MLGALTLDTSCSRSSASRTAAESASARPVAESNGGAVPAVSSAKPVLLFVGTSLTAGLGLDPDSAYPMLIQQKIDSAGLSYTVTNAGVSGETSSGLLDRLDWLLRGNFSTMVLETGANDGLRGVAPSTLKKNLETIVDRVRSARPNARIFLVQMEALPNLGPKYAADFHAIYPAVAKEKGIPLLPFLLDGVAGRRELNQSDGMHPNLKGEHIVADHLWKALEPLLAHNDLSS